LRRGNAAARVLARGRGRLLGVVSRLAALAAGTPDVAGLVAARRGEVFAAVWTAGARVLGPVATAPAELATVRADLLLADLAVVESSLHKAEKRAKGRAAADVEALGRAREALDAETPLRDAKLSPEDVAELKGIAALTMKPEVVVANLEEGASPPVGLGDAAGVFASIEAETAEMEPGEARSLLEEFGVEEPGLQTVISACYRALDLITFLTTGEDETRAWEVRRGATAPEAAGVIHTDLQRGFIRAEVIGFDELVAAGSMEAARSAGKIRVEGKDYPVQEGDVLHVRFAV